MDPALKLDVEDAEKRIQHILLDLEEASGRHVDNVRVDTRNFANCSVEIFFKVIAPCDDAEFGTSP